MKNYKNLLLLVAFVLAGCNTSTPATTDTNLPETPEETVSNAPVELTFITHLQAQLPEQDVFVMHEGDTENVYRVEVGEEDAYLEAEVYNSAEPTVHGLNTGPYPKGEAMGMTLGEWLSASGTGQLSCENGKGSFKAEFSNLVPNGVYTMWNAFGTYEPVDNRLKFLDLAAGKTDGSESVFTADAEGSANYQVGLDTCFQGSGEQLMAVFAIALHSDEKTYGSSPGTFGTISHVQLFVPLP